MSGAVLGTTITLLLAGPLPAPLAALIEQLYCAKPVNPVTATELAVPATFAVRVGRLVAVHVAV